MKPTLLQLEQKTSEAKNICYECACKLHDVYELENFCEELHWTAREFAYTIKEKSGKDFANSVISDYLKTVNVDYFNIYFSENKSIFCTFLKIRKSIASNITRTASTYLESFYKGDFETCIKLFNKF